MRNDPSTRRQVLAGSATLVIGSLAGCNSVLGDDATPTPLELGELDDRTVYVDPELSLSAPDDVTTTDVPGDADVLLVPADTDRSESAIVHWLARDAYVAFVGDGAQATWHDVKLSEAYAAMLGEPEAMASTCSGSSSGSGGGSGDTASDCEPPDVVVAWRLEHISTTYGRTWEGTDDPSSRQVFSAVEDALDDE